MCNMRKAVVVLVATMATLAATADRLAMGQAGSPPKPNAVLIQFDNDAIAITTEGIGKLKISYPQLTVGQETAKPTEIKPAGNRVTLKYANGATLNLTLQNGRKIQFHFTGLPAQSKMRMEMDLPASLRDGGKWAADANELKPFPAEKGEQFVFKGNIKSSRFAGGRGSHLAIGIEHGWQQLQDNRAFGGDGYGWMAAADLPAAGESYYSMNISDGSPEPEPARVVKKPAGPEKTSFRLVDGGVQLDAGSMGKFTVTWPAPGPALDKAHKLIEKKIVGNKATLKYEGGGQIELTLGPDGAIAMKFEAMPADVKHVRMEVPLDFNFSQGGTWKVDQGSETPFPKEKPAKPFLFQGHGEQYTFKSIEGRTLAISVPKHTFAQLQDNREWGWKIFYLWYAFNYDRNVSEYGVKLAVGGETAAKVLVDRFGQTTLADYAEKVKSLEQLKADTESERQWLASLRPPKFDTFGGLPGSGAKLGLKKTGFFHLEKHGERWFLVNPEGNAFFQLGVCVFSPGDDYTYIAGREHAFEWLPPAEATFASAYRANDPTAFSFHLANRVRKTGQPYYLDGYLATMIARTRQWGFNSGGAFSPTFQPAQKAANWPYVGGLPLSVWDGIAVIPGVEGAWDPFEEKNRQRVEELFRQRVAPHADDPLLIGCFLGNEPLYEKLPKVLPTLDGKFACKRRLVRMLEEKYKSVDGFNQAWSAQVKSFEELTDRGLAVATAAAKQDVRDFVGLYLDEYYRLVSETFRKYDKNHLLLGSRFQPITIKDEQLCRICGKYMDIVSFNYYTYHLDKDLLNKLHGWTGGKPMLLSEFYFSSPSDSGLPGGGNDVKGQAARGLAYRDYVEQGASLPFIVGIQWFTLVDQAVTGRFFEKYNGENGNTGLISVADRPWKAMLGPMMETNYSIYDVVLGQRKPFAYDDPRFHPAGNAPR